MLKFKTMYIDDVVNKINSNLLEITALDIENDLVRNSDLGSLVGFSNCKEIFENIMKLSQELKDGNLKSLPVNHLNSVENLSGNVLDRLQKIKNFKPYVDSVNRETYVKEIENAYNAYLEGVFNDLAFLRVQKFNEIKSSEIEEDFKRQNNRLKEVANEADSSLKELKDTLVKVRQASGEVGIAKYSECFKSEAEENQKASKRWLIGIIFTALITIIGGFVLLFWMKPAISAGEIVQHSIARFIILSVLFYILVWVTKSYNAHKHNYVVNKHRANSLNSFETFVKSTEDSGTKDAVLLQATQSIFSPQPSGYDHNDGGGDSASKFIEIFRHFEPKK